MFATSLSSSSSSDTNLPCADNGANARFEVREFLFVGGRIVALSDALYDELFAGLIGAIFDALFDELFGELFDALDDTFVDELEGAELACAFPDEGAELACAFPDVIDEDLDTDGDNDLSSCTESDVTVILRLMKWPFSSKARAR